MNIKGYAKFWQQICPMVKMAFSTGMVSASQPFKDIYEKRTGNSFDKFPKIPPVGLEPMVPRSNNIILANVIMPYGHVYEAVIRPKITESDRQNGITMVHLVWLKAVSFDEVKLIPQVDMWFSEIEGSEKEENIT